MANRGNHWRGYAQGTRLMREFLLRLLRPGDLLFYSGTGFFSRMIKFKTASEWTHVAVYVGNGLQREFKELQDAQEVPFRTANLGMIKRRLGNWDPQLSAEFWSTVKDQKYDYIGILLSFYARKQGRLNNKMFCSEYVIRDDRRAVTDEVKLVADEIDADGVTPEDVSKSPNTVIVWMAKDGARKKD